MNLGIFPTDTLTIMYFVKNKFSFVEIYYNKIHILDRRQPFVNIGPKCAPCATGREYATGLKF